MAKILILQEQPGTLRALRMSLQENNHLYFVKTTTEAMAVLKSNEIDLIIARVHLESGNVFDFIQHIKGDPRYKNLPLICFCGKRSGIAKFMCANLAHTSHVIGADRYICLEKFCAEEQCDFDNLRQEIEAVLTQKNS